MDHEESIKCSQYDLKLARDYLPFIFIYDSACNIFSVEMRIVKTEINQITITFNEKEFYNSFSEIPESNLVECFNQFKKKYQKTVV